MKLNDIRSTARARLALLLGGSILAAILVTLGVLAATGMLTRGNRQAMVHAQGGAVMPFDLDRTTHVFTTAGTGGVETVIAKDASDSQQIMLIQQHLQQEALRFQEGKGRQRRVVGVPGADDTTNGHGRGGRAGARAGTEPAGGRAGDPPAAPEVGCGGRPTP